MPLFPHRPLSSGSRLSRGAASLLVRALLLFFFSCGTIALTRAQSPPPAPSSSELPPSGYCSSIDLLIGGGPSYGQSTRVDAPSSTTADPHHLARAGTFDCNFESGQMWLQVDGGGVGDPYTTSPTQYSSLTLNGDSVSFDPWFDTNSAFKFNISLRPAGAVNTVRVVFEYDNSMDHGSPKRECYDVEGAYETANCWRCDVEITATCTRQTNTNTNTPPASGATSTASSGGETPPSGTPPSQGGLETGSAESGAIPIPTPTPTPSSTAAAGSPPASGGSAGSNDGDENVGGGGGGSPTVIDMPATGGGAESGTGTTITPNGNGGSGNAAAACGANHVGLAVVSILAVIFAQMQL